MQAYCPDTHLDLTNKTGFWWFYVDVILVLSHEQQEGHQRREEVKLGYEFCNAAWGQTQMGFERLQ